MYDESYATQTKNKTTKWRFYLTAEFLLRFQKLVNNEFRIIF